MMGRALIAAIVSMTSWLKAPCKTSAEGRDGCYRENDLNGGEAEQCGRLHKLNDLGQVR